MRGPGKLLVVGFCTIAFSMAGFAPTTWADGWLPGFGRPTSVEKLARDIDILEKHVDCYGSIVAKSPDVWGQARLTRHRDEFEKQMSDQLTRFQFTLNSAISRSDQAFLASATALGAAVSGASGQPAAQGPPNTASAQVLLPGLAGTAGDPKTNPVVPPSNANTNVYQTPLGQLPGLSNFGANGPTLSLEPTTNLDQMARYLNHLHELRRINEGDDTADSPGYSLNLVRIPVSVLPGQKTRKGFGAEITITATPFISDELLPHTFRSLVINDLVDIVSFKIAKIAEPTIEASLKRPSEPGHGPDLGGAEQTRRESKQTRVKLASAQIEPQVKPASLPAQRNLEKIKSYVARIQPGLTNDEINSRAMSATIVAQVEAAKSASAGNHGRVRRSRSPIPPTQIGSVLGGPELEDLTHVVIAALVDQIAESAPLYRPNLLDIRAFIREELDAAYDLLSRPESQSIWESTVGFNNQLVTLVRTQQKDLLCQVRHDLNARLLGERSTPVGQDAQCDQELSDWTQPSTTRHLAWAILVEAALLNEQLVIDMKRIASERGCPCVSAVPLPLFLPDPPPEARAAFIEYVKCRWPIHVFAVDPVTQDQNVADTFSRRRETQLALALAFANGQINAQNMTRFVRRLELDMQTIALNRTMVGFSHGSDTFGWRFFPRVQSPPEESNMTVLFRDLLFGGPTRDQDMRQRQLEPGQRECTAIVIMPSFVPYVTFDTRSNWFPLTNCKKREISIKDTVRLSKLIRSMQDSVAECVRGGHKYRDGEVYRLVKRVDQLSGELPLQTQFVQVPYENSLGGFEMFANGTSDLSPQLLGFYGEPGVNLGTETTLFLLGDHFSVHDTRVVVGNTAVRPELLSRQVMQVTIPAGVQPVNKPLGAGNLLEQPVGGKKSSIPVVDVHIATPYGVSSHLQIPVVPSAADTSLGFHWETTEAYESYTYKDDKANSAFKIVSTQPSPPDDVFILAPTNMVALDTASLTLTCSTADNTTIASFQFATVAFDARRGSYRLSLAQIDTQLKTALTTFLTNQYYPAPLPESFEVRIMAKFDSITGVKSTPPIDGTFNLTLRLKKQ